MSLSCTPLGNTETKDNRTHPDWMSCGCTVGGETFERLAKEDQPPDGGQTCS